MKAILKHDEILMIGDRHGVEVGNIPSGIGFERLRWNGSTLVDLMDLAQIWVKEEHPRFYKLHSIQVPGSQLVTMAYTDRKHLLTENGIIRVKTPQEQTDEQTAKADNQIDNRTLKAELRTLVSDLTYAKIDTHIDNVFGGLTTAQKTSLKRLYKVVLFLAKGRYR
jgi:hypothetical protein